MVYSSGNIVVFTIGRMNPPTPGHMALIEKLIHLAAVLGQKKIGIILSHSQDMPKNPFNCNEKRNLLLSGMITALKNQMKQKSDTYNPPISPESINAIEPIIICMDDEMPAEFGKNPILKSVNTLIASYNGPVRQAFLIVGQDRAGGYEFVKADLEKKGIALDDSNFLIRPEGAISATYMRELAYSGNWDEFLRIYSTIGMPDENVKAIYDGLRAMAASASTSTSKKSKKGGRRTKRRNARKSKKSKKSKKNKKNNKTKKYYK
jgi:nicotinic acid mononucleotide adenylyltransferase